MTLLIDQHKALVFQEKYPGFLDKSRELKKFLSQNIGRDLRFGVKILPIFDDIYRGQKDLEKKKYTTEPIAEEILIWRNKMDSGELKMLIDEHNLLLTSDTNISDQKNKEGLSDFFFSLR